MRVHLWGELAFYGPGKQGRLELPIDHPMPAFEVLRLIGVPAADVAVFGVNGVVVRIDDPAVTVADGDRIDCFPPTSGG